MPKPTIEWIGGADGAARIIDQTRLPVEYATLDITTPERMAEAIRKLELRGAPAIGVGAAYALVLAVGNREFGTEGAILDAIDAAARLVKSARPTAVNLFWAADLAASAARAAKGKGVSRIRQALFAQARAIHDEDRATCRKIAEFGQEILPDGARVLTHCNAGALATADYGTALGVIYRAHELGKSVSVFADETRPLLQGSRLTAWELMDAGIDVTVICDAAAASAMSAGKVDLVITGADRIAANGDTANKIGTLGLAILADEFAIPFYVAAPASTFDLKIESGDYIPIEERSPEEVTHVLGKRMAPEGVKAWNPAFDVTPARLITAIVTEKGIIHKPNRQAVAAVLGKSGAS